VTRVAILGGGVSGLTAAFYLEQERRRGAPLSFTVFESADRFGGVIRTERIDGCIVEAGPDSFLSTKPWARELCDDLRLSSQLIGSRDDDRKTYVLLNGLLEPIPSGMQMMVPTSAASVLRSRIFSRQTKLAMAREYLLPPQPLGADDDESVASFVSRHFNSEVVDRLADPLLTGIYGADASALSARATLPTMIDMEARHRSLVRGALAAKASQAASGAAQPLFTALRDGMQRIVESIMRHVPREALRSSRAIEGITPLENGWQLRSQETTEDFDHLILAVPAHVSAKILADLPASERAVELLSEIGYSSVVAVALAYNNADISLPPGFGFLVPRSEGKRLIACTFVHNKFENRAPTGTALLRVFMGGSRDSEILDETEEEIINIVRRELREILHIDATPQFVRVFKWHKAMPQYGVGHLLRVARLEMHMQRFPSLHLSGNAYHGIGIPDCVRAGRAAADAIMRRMRSQGALA